VRALVFIEDPGAANFILPVLPLLSARGVDVQLRTSGVASDYITQRVGTTHRPPETGAEELVAQLRPDVVVIGTSENEDTLGLPLVSAARRRKIPTIGAVDILANADQRFRGRGARPLSYAPDVILTADAATRSAFISFGHDPAKVIVTGHPHYDEVRERARRLDAEGRAAVRRRCVPDAPLDRSVLVFVAEVSTGLNPAQYRVSSDYTLRGGGRRSLRTEIVLEELLDALSAMQIKPYKVLRLHPKNTRAEFAEFLPQFDAVSDAGLPLDLIYAADAVVGMSSMLLYEAALIGRPTLAILPRAAEKEWLPAGADGVVPVATSRANVHRMVREILTQGSSTSKPPPSTAAAELAAQAVLAVISSAA